MFDAILLMAGSGLRSGLDYNKIFYQINNKYVYQYSLNAFEKIKECLKIILVVHQDDVSKFFPLQSDKIIITTGGETRQESVIRGIRQATSDIVLIHDGARCNIKGEDIINVYHNTLKYGAAVLGTKVTDTIKEVNGEFIDKTLNRQKLWAVQTPQGVKRELFLECLEKATSDNYFGFDDVELIEKYSKNKVRIVEGSRTNLKLTSPVDFKLMEFIMKEGL